MNPNLRFCVVLKENVALYVNKGKNYKNSNIKYSYLRMGCYQAQCIRDKIKKMPKNSLIELIESKYISPCL